MLFIDRFAVGVEVHAQRLALRVVQADLEVAGEADIYLVNSIEECNIIAKALINFADTVFAGVITGARVPVSLVSRTDTMKNKKASVSIACLVAEYYQKIGMGEQS